MPVGYADSVLFKMAYKKTQYIVDPSVLCSVEDFQCRSDCFPKRERAEVRNGERKRGGRGEEISSIF